MITIIVTGSREYKDAYTMRRVFTEVKKEFGAFRLVHGNQRGADKLSEFICRSLGITDIQRYDANWDLYGKAAGPIRNREMIDKELTRGDCIIVIGFPLENSVGTYDCMNYAAENKLEIRCIEFADRKNISGT